ncbi:UDP-glucose--hexose-1-phosphate uridylyltransferase [Alteribacter natronophilus]|uniref:UDP-glucose--hexose-1-phosphate uridylyltransferase n=1 Tax=Alteribacter natronophilus TaxID=2583810 RepID=UPI00110D3B04|nr:UDP-glucose--hexose-1-phosphate uridylyltransferase [Alteribacter natronophilus]TMW70409.1 UDP-glucose--hexose-1-phosphate uridylyltransferase [Alteribacter natronophilus]
MSTQTVERSIERLVQYAQQKQLIESADIPFARNSLLALMEVDDPVEPRFEAPEEALEHPAPILEELLDHAFQRGLIKNNTVTERDLFDTKLMGCLTPRPSEVIREFGNDMEAAGAEAATRNFYTFSQDVHYIRRDRICKNLSWFTHTDYGNLEITVNLSKPEKDPKEIAALKEVKGSDYPKCLLCKENVGYRGRLNHPARQNLRTLPLSLNDEGWQLQFSPYVYYNEHAIIFREEHTPMKISRETFRRLLSFAGQFPHYFIGSNADLPIVGGSILSHDHFQGGKHEFPMAVAETEEVFPLQAFGDVTAGIVKWPMSVVRLTGSSMEEVTNAADHVLTRWKGYSDESVDVLANSGDTPHHTITPIARMRGGKFELDLVLRNNRTSDEHPMGIFHPHAEVHHIKKENIGLIEVMGLAVLPGRLQSELEQLETAMLSDDPAAAIESNEVITKHKDWALSILERHREFSNEKAPVILKEEVGQVFSTILEHAGVFKRDAEGKEAFKRFMEDIQG